MEQIDWSYEIKALEAHLGYCDESIERNLKRAQRHLAEAQEAAEAKKATETKLAKLKELQAAKPTEVGVDFEIRVTR